MEPLMRLVVPELDGGLLRPLFDTVSENVGNFTAHLAFNSTGLTFGDPLLLNVTVPGNDRAAKATQNSNGTNVDIGKPLLAWYFGRLQSQVPLFVVCTLLWLLLLGCLLALFLCLRRSQSRQTRRIGRVSDIQQKRLKPLFGLLTVILLLIVIGSVMAILHWSGRAQFSGMSELSGNDTSQNASAGRSHLIATFRRTIDEFDEFVEQSIVDTNITVLSVCKAELPNVLAVLKTIGTYLLDRLAEDFKLAPLLVSFDEFINLVKLLVSSMRVIKESRSEVVAPLAEFTTRVDTVRRDLGKLVTDACQDAGRSPSAPPKDLCDRVNDGLARLAVGVDHRQLDSDSSVTIVTLLEKMLKLNFSQVEGQVESAKGQLYGNLDLVSVEVRKLFDEAVVTVSDKFHSAIVSAEDFRSNLRKAKRDRGFLDAMEVIDRTVLGLGVSLGIGSFAFLAVLVLALFVSIRFLLSFRGGARGGERRGSSDMDSNGDFKLKFISSSSKANGNGASTVSPRSSNGHGGGGGGGGPLLGDDAVVLPRSRQRFREPRDWHSICLLTSCLLVLAALIYASVVFYAGSEAQMDVCRYLTTSPGVAKVDHFVGRLVEDKLWPQLETLLERTVKIPLGITKAAIPKRLLGPLLDACGNSSTTIFQALELGSLVNVSLILRSSLVQAELSKGSDMIQGKVLELNTSALIPAEVDDLLQKTLPSFAGVMDAEDFSPSIRELRKPLLLIGGARLPSLRADLSQLEASLLHVNSSDRRAVLIRYFSEQADSLIAGGNWTLTEKLGHLLQHYGTLQANRHLTNLTLKLTANALALKATLSDKQFLLSSIGARYNETIREHMSAIIDLASDVLSRLQANVGKCRPLLDIFRHPIGWCTSQIQPVPYTGFYMMVSCLAFYSIVLLLLTLMHLIKRQTADGPKVHS